MKNTTDNHQLKKQEIQNKIAAFRKDIMANSSMTDEMKQALLKKADDLLEKTRTSKSIADDHIKPSKPDPLVESKEELSRCWIKESEKTLEDTKKVLLEINRKRKIRKKRRYDFSIFPICWAATIVMGLILGLINRTIITGQSDNEVIRGLFFFLTFVGVAAPFFLIFPKKKCPKCSSKEFGAFEEFYKSKYRHTNKDGSKDLRYKRNPLSNYYEVFDYCKECGYESEKQIKIR